jgi:hypothetical protein
MAQILRKLAGKGKYRRQARDTASPLHYLHLRWLSIPLQLTRSVAQHRAHGPHPVAILDQNRQA